MATDEYGTAPQYAVRASGPRDVAEASKGSWSRGMVTTAVARPASTTVTEPGAA